MDGVERRQRSGVPAAKPRTYETSGDLVAVRGMATQPAHAQASTSVGCATDADGSCSGVIKLWAMPRRGEPFFAGERRFSDLPPGGIDNIDVRLSPKALRVLRKTGRLVVRITIRATDGSGTTRSRVVVRVLKHKR